MPRTTKLIASRLGNSYRSDQTGLRQAEIRGDALRRHFAKQPGEVLSPPGDQADIGIDPLVAAAAVRNIPEPSRRSGARRTSFPTCRGKLDELENSSYRCDRVIVDTMPWQRVLWSFHLRQRAATRSAD